MCGLLQVLIEMDRQDEQCGRMEEILQQLHCAYCQFTLTSHDLCKASHAISSDDGDSSRDPEDIKPGLVYPILDKLTALPKK